MPVNSHIQMPRLILKNFTNKEGRLFYYDFENKKMGSGFPKTFYTEYGYYSDDAEAFLDAEIESRLGTLMKFLKTTCFERNENPPIEYTNIAFDYVYSLIARSPSLQQQINVNSVFFQFCNSVSRHDIAAHDVFIRAKKRGLLSQYSVSFLDNKSSEELILPTGGVTQCGKKLFCPVSPQRAIVFDDTISESCKEVAVVNVYEVADQETIHNINVQSIRQEQVRDGKYIISGNNDLLKRLVADTWLENGHGA